ncbi:MAG: hypothetical protein IPN26_02205 [Bacteroidetes bacterium]|nr:hypothetical protein [Bacteroidota bacterium]
MGLYDDSGFIPCLQVLNSPDGGVIISTRNGFYQLKKQLPIKCDSLTETEFDQLSIKGMTFKKRKSNSDKYFV